MFRILDQVFIDHTMDASRKYPVKMRQQLDIATIVAAHVGEVVRRITAIWENLLEVRHAAIERVAANVDYFGVWKCGADQSEVMEIARHLVGKTGTRRFPIRAAELNV